MPLTSIPTKTDDSIGRVKSNAEAIKNLDVQVPAEELENIKSALIDACDEVGVHQGTAGSINSRLDPVETKLGGIEDGADVTDTANVQSAGAFLADGSVSMTGSFNAGGFNVTNVGTVDGRNLSTDGAKLDGVEAGADVTDAANVQAAGALFADGSVHMTGNLQLGDGVTNFDITNVNQVDGRDLATDGVKLDGVEAGADVTDAANVQAAGAFFADGSVAMTGAFDGGGFNVTNVGTVDGRNLSTDGVKLDGVEAGADVTDAVNVQAAGALFADGSVAMTGNLQLGDGVTNFDILNVNQVDGRDLATDGAKLDGVEAGADVTDAANVQAAGAFFADGSVAMTGAADLGGFDLTNLGNITTISGTVDGRDLSTDGAKLDGVEAGADVTDAANVQAAGALFADGSVHMTGNLQLGDGVTNFDITNVNQVDGRDLATDGVKLDGVEAGADVTDAANVQAAGAFFADGSVAMTGAADLGGFDLTNLGNITTISGTVDGRDLSTDGAKLDGVEAGADVTDAANVQAAGALFADGSVAMTGNLQLGDGVTNFDILNVNQVDGRDLSTDGSKLDGVEAGADVTDAANVQAAGAFFADGSVAMTGAFDGGGFNVTNVGTVDGRDLATDGVKLDGVEAGADVTDYTSVKSAGSLMTDGTAVMSGDLQLGDGNINFDILNVNQVDGRDLSTDGAKLDGVEAGADVTDAANVQAAGALFADGSVAMTGNLQLGDGVTNFDITNVNQVDGRDLATDGSKLDGVEAGADITDAANVQAAGAFFADGSVAMTGAADLGGFDLTNLGNITTISGTVDGRDLSTDGAKLDGVEAGADVTDAANVQAAGALFADGSVAMTGNLQLGDGNTNFDITNVNQVDGRDLSTDGAKLDGVEAGADVTDYTNVKSAGSIMSDGTVSMASSLSMGGNEITSVGPTAPTTEVSSFTVKSGSHNQTVVCDTTQGSIVATAPQLSAGTTVSLVQSGENQLSVSAGSGVTVDPGSGFTADAFTDGSMIVLFYETSSYVRVMGERGEV